MSEQDTETKSQNLPKPRGEWGTFESLRADIDSLFDQFNPFARGGRDLASRAFPQMRALGQPMMDLTETDEGYELCIDLPGVKRDDIEIKLAGDMLTISGQMQQENEETRKNVLLMERRQGSFRRSMTLPPDADEAAIAADMSDGVLKVSIPKSADARQSERKIEIKPRS